MLHVQKGGAASILFCYSPFFQEGLELVGVMEGGAVKEGEGEVGKFLNRILGLKVQQQNLVRL